MEIKKIKLKMSEEGPTRKVSDYSGSDDTCQWCLRSKIGIWHICWGGV